MVDTSNWKEDKKYGGYMTPKYVREREGNKQHPNFCKHCGSTVVLRGFGLPDQRKIGWLCTGCGRIWGMKEFRR